MRYATYCARISLVGPKHEPNTRQARSFARRSTQRRGHECVNNGTRRGVRIVAMRGFHATRGWRWLQAAVLILWAPFPNTVRVEAVHERVARCPYRRRPLGVIGPFLVATGIADIPRMRATNVGARVPRKHGT
jgi:hypothetical protein